MHVKWFNRFFLLLLLLVLRIDTTLRVAPTSSEWHRGGAQASFVLVLLSGRSAGLPAACIRNGMFYERKLMTRAMMMTYSLCLFSCSVFVCFLLLLLLLVAYADGRVEGSISGF